MQIPGFWPITVEPLGTFLVSANVRQKDTLDISGCFCTDLVLSHYIGKFFF